MSDPVARIVDGRLCAGCGACTQLGPDLAMAVDAEGYLRPQGRLAPGKEAAFKDICPGTGLTQTPDTREDHPLWGPIVAVRSGHGTDADIRYSGSSGGGITAVLVHLLEEGMVDGVIQIGAADAPPFGNRTILSRSRDEVIAAAGSRYAPSAPLEGLDAYLDGTEQFAFVGKPCDVAALRGLARHDPRIDQRIPYMLSFFCAGVPSLKGAEAVVAALGVERDDLAAFRYRGEGWPGFARATRRDGTSETMTYHDSWGKILSSHVQFRCKICPDGTGGFADLVCADAWETDAKGYPLFTEGAGTSLIVTRTQKGEALAQAAQAAGRLEMTDYAVDKIAGMQPGQLSKRQYGAARLAALAVLGKARPRYTGFHLLKGARAARPAAVLKNFLGTLRRVWRGSY